MTSTQTTDTKPARERRSWTVVLEDGASARFEVRLEKRRDGWRTYARHVVGAGKSRKATRGATEQHTDEKTARAGQTALVTAAEKAGWKRRETRGGFAARPDAFGMTNLPAPSKSKK